MLTNYLKIAYRNLVRHKGYAFINVFGLAVGLGVCLTLALYVRHEARTIGFCRTPSASTA